MKRILSIVIIAAMLCPMYAYAAPIYTDNVAAMLSELKIMQGDPDGNMRYDDLVSRAECTKIAVAASTFRDTVALGSKTSPFSDVTYTHWAAPFVTVGINNGLVKGYLDATFRPNDAVLYEEATTIFLRVLGYADSDFGASWPDGQVGIAKNIGILDNIDKSIGQKMTRRDIATMVYNTLNTKKKGSQTALLSDHNRTVIDDVVLISTMAEDANIPEGKIYTSAGTYNFTDTLDTSQIGRRGSLILRGGDTVVSFIPQGSITSGTDVRMVYQTLGNGIITYKNGAFSQIDIDNSTVFYQDSAKVSANIALSSLKMGDTLRISYKSNGEIDYIMCTRGTTEGPMTVKSSEWYESFGAQSDITVMRDGVKSSVADVKINDIAYYLKELNIALLYSKKVTGIYEDAAPNKDAPTSVTVSGVTYNIEGVDAFYKLSSNGTFELGDTVTLLLGKSGDVADVLTQTQLSDKVYGYLVSTGTKETSISGTSVVRPYIKVILPSGESCEYITTKDYSSYLNRIVSVTLKNGTATVSTLSSQSSVSGKFVWTSGIKTLGSNDLSQDVKIIEVSTTEISQAGKAKAVFPQRLNGINLSTSDILYASKNSVGEIDELILLDKTGDMHSYGILTEASSSSGIATASGRYTYIENGIERSISTSNKSFGVSRGQAVKIKSSDNGSVISITPLSKAASGKIASISGSQITVSGNSYTMSDKVNIYLKKSYEYTMITIDELDDLKNNYTATVYQDKSSSSGGRIRIIVLS